MNLLNAVAHTDWDADGATLFKLYRLDCDADGATLLKLYRLHVKSKLCCMALDEWCMGQREVYTFNLGDAFRSVPIRYCLGL